jgi:GT2 family glycosyltransferase
MTGVLELSRATIVTHGPDDPSCSSTATDGRMTTSARPPDLAVVIVSWNTRVLLAECLEVLGAELARESPEALPPLAADVWVVDNHSADGSTDLVRTRFPWVRLVENPENVGFARATNQGIRASRGRHVLLLNPDTRLRPGALGTLVDVLDDRREAGIAGACLVSADGTPQVSAEVSPTLGRELRRLFHLGSSAASSPKGSAPPRPVDIVPGTCMLLRRSMLDAVGLLDEGYFMYSEDVDLCRRARGAGWAVYWVPAAEVVHLGGQSTRQVPAAMFLQLHESKVRYIRKHHGPGAARLYKLILAGAALARLLVSPAAWLEPVERRRTHQELAGRYRGLLRALPRL